MAALTKVCPTRVMTVRPPASATSLGTECEVILLITMVLPGSRASSRTAISPVMADGETTSPRSSITKQRSASPSNTTARSAPCSRTAAWASTRLAGSSGFGGWFGKLPSRSR